MGKYPSRQFVKERNPIWDASFAKLETLCPLVDESLCNVLKHETNLALDIDPLSHPAWTGGKQQVSEGGRVAQFNKRFGGLSLKNK